MPKKPPTPLDQPTRGTVDALFRDLTRDMWRHEFADVQEAEKRADQIQRDLLAASKPYQAAKKKATQLRDAAAERHKKRSQEIFALRQLYQAVGLTDEVKTKLEALVRKDAKHGKEET